jgi:phosphonate transport system substrate-binding protein
MMGELKTQIVVFVLALALMAPFSFAKTPENSVEPLEIGVVPIFNAATVIPFFKPLQTYLEQKLQRPVLLVTAPDHQTFVKRTQHGDYPIVITSAHYARLAQKEAKYRPILCTQKKQTGAVIVLKDGQINHLSQLKGKIIAFPNFISMSSVLGRSFLRSQHLSPGKDIQVRYFNSLSSSLYAVSAGEAEAAIASPIALNFLPEEINSKFKIIAKTKDAPNVFVLTHPQLSKTSSNQIAQLILDFSKTPEGEKFGAASGFVSFTRPTASEMKSLDRFVPELKTLLNNNNT